MDFNFENFKYNAIAIYCNNEKEIIDFINKCEENNISVNDRTKEVLIKHFKDGICLDCSDSVHIGYANYQYYKIRNYEIIEWEIENKIDYDGIYTFMEVINNIKNNEKWISIDTLYTLQSIEKVENHIVFNYDGNMSNKSLTIDINTRFKLVKKDKKVTFEEAIQAYNEYKTIKCIWLDYIYEFQYQNNEANLINLEEDRLLNLILEGEWYIKED
ncbi:hypothetical protein RSJ21_09330 [Clostridium botulinum]|uniref:hypothetical protein n=1 Tax=Clostridium botulinum TaxID=1491 RepID=UPI000A170737|nr:hypothetical protein [Clostridium botulinum]AUN10420.1 hypothetical protein RSJ6_07850 [Clostridium botulinum]AUN25442.1 hypothetical protein RSJ21_09330 [Clostridium botulinum]OSA65642.1 hypothetical protein B2H87_19595 [Clostridium botulinum]QDY21063.1 hypothetical protein CGQ39_08850 [Clostridium botulinum]